MRRDAAELEATTYPDPYEIAREFAERMGGRAAAAPAS